MKDLYLIQSDVTGAIKIGVSNTPEKRLKQLQTGSPYRLKLIGVFKEKGDKEKVLHQLLQPYRQNIKRQSTKGEWFDFMCMGTLPLWIIENLDLDTVNTWWET